jgi:hypothetical protein
MFDPIELSAGKLQSLAYITGVYLGDGGVFYNKANRSYLFILNTIDKDFAEYTARHLKNLLGKEARIYERPEKPPRKPFYRVEVHSKDLYFFLLEECQRKLAFPNYVYHLSKENRKLVLRGLFDSDGWFSKAKGKYVVCQLGIAKSNPYIADVPALLRSVNVDCGKLRPMKKRDKDSKQLFRVLVNKRSWILNGMKFTAYRKQSRVDEYAATSETITLEAKEG